MTCSASSLGQLPEIGPVKDIDIDGRGPGGRVTSVTLVGDNGHAKIAFEYPVRKLFDNLSSGAFALDVVHDDNGHIARATFRGAGWGHGVGMCPDGRNRPRRGRTELQSHSGALL